MPLTTAPGHAMTDLGVFIDLVSSDDEQAPGQGGCESDSSNSSDAVLVGDTQDNNAALLEAQAASRAAATQERIRAAAAAPKKAAAQSSDEDSSSKKESEGLPESEEEGAATAIRASEKFARLVELARADGDRLAAVACYGEAAAATVAACSKDYVAALSAIGKAAAIGPTAVASARIALTEVLPYALIRLSGSSYVQALSANTASLMCCRSNSEFVPFPWFPLDFLAARDELVPIKTWRRNMRRIYFALSPRNSTPSQIPTCWYRPTATDDEA